MSVKVKIPTQLRQVTGGNSELQFEDVATLRSLLDKLREQYPSLIERILDESGEIRRFINMYVGDEDVRFLQGLDTPLEEPGTVSILPAVAGGSG